MKLNVVRIRSASRCGSRILDRTGSARLTREDRARGLVSEAADPEEYADVADVRRRVADARVYIVRQQAQHVRDVHEDDWSNGCYRSK